MSAELKTRKQNYQRSVTELRQRTAQLERVRAERSQRFTDCYQHIADQIDAIYKVRLDLRRVLNTLRFIISLPNCDLFSKFCH